MARILGFPKWPGSVCAQDVCIPAKHSDGSRRIAKGDRYTVRPLVCVQKFLDGARTPGCTYYSCHKRIETLECDREFKAMGRTICPRCKEHRVRRSCRRGFFEAAVLRLVRMRPYRCQGCDRRFFALAHPNSEDYGYSYSPLARREVCETAPDPAAALRQPQPRRTDAYEGAVAWLQQHNSAPQGLILRSERRA